MRTQKKDWLNDALAQTGRVIVSGHSTTSSILGLPEKSIATFRFAGNRNYIIALFLTVESPRINWNSIVAALIANDERGHNIISAIKDRMKKPIVCIMYDENHDDFGIVERGQMKVLTGDELKCYLGSIDGRLISNSTGTLKEINKSINDKFQLWGRANLSKYLVVNDLDALTIPDTNNSMIIYELKRIKEDVTTWMPYLDDEANYAAISKLCDLAGARLRVIAYQSNNKKLVAVHHIIKTSPSAIEGNFICCIPEHIVEIPIGQKYVSTRRRV